ncbi:MAG: 4'-phosphopantetheinyl transferase superfamily protein [Burkholderiales bacterium]|nr:4'-phosphopantetheinyl transferase superfamily protein [Burkholderiales bacterium]
MSGAPHGTRALQPGDDGNAPGLRRLAAPAPDIELWFAPLSRSAGEIGALATLLSAAETARAARFGRPELSDRYVVGRATLRMLVGQHLGIAPAEVAIRRGERGRPHTTPESGIDFNVSHTRGVALFGITTNRRIGVDIEHGDRTLNVAGIARKFMSPREQSALQALAPDARRVALLRLWTCKEAMSKATGDALSAPFRRLDVESDGQLRLVDGPPPYLPADWQLHAVTVPGGHLATVALWRGR